jgi:hypothetical protein
MGCWVKAVLACDCEEYKDRNAYKKHFEFCFWYLQFLEKCVSFSFIVGGNKLYKEISFLASDDIVS